MLRTRQRLPGYRRVLAHPVAITMEAEHAVAALEEAFAKYGWPEIVNTDQGSQFTSTVFTDAVVSPGVALSMASEAGGTTFLSNGCGAA
jgi:putative transposase